MFKIKNFTFVLQICTLIQLNGFWWIWIELGAIKEKTYQCTTVCTSSHTTATAFFLKKSLENIPRNLSTPTNDSGLPQRRSISAVPSIILLSISALSPTKAAFKPSDLKYFTWSLMIEFKGQTTITKGETKLLSQYFFTEGKNWNVILFSNPVGSAAKTSFPRTMFLIPSTCSGFNSFMPGKYIHLNEVHRKFYLTKYNSQPCGTDRLKTRVFILERRRSRAARRRFDAWHNYLARAMKGYSGLEKFQSQQVI